MNDKYIAVLNMSLDIDAEIEEMSDPLKTNNSQIIQCPKCGQQIEKDYDYCPFCGEKLVKETSGKDDNGSESIKEHCPNCGQPIDSSDKYCMNCGVNITKYRAKQKKAEAKEYKSEIVKENDIKPKKNKLLLIGIICCIVLSLIVGIIVIIKPGRNPIADNTDNGQYLTVREMDDQVYTKYVEYITGYNDSHKDTLYGYLVDPIKNKRTAEHVYSYYYVYLVGDGQTTKVSFEVAIFEITANPDKTYTLEVKEKSGEPVYLKCINSSSMNVRKTSSLSGEIIGSIDTGDSFKVKDLDFSEYQSGGNYIWYSFENSNNSKWVADGIMLEKDYYVFENGQSTKKLCLIFTGRWRF